MTIASRQPLVSHAYQARYHGGILTAIPIGIVWHDTQGNGAKEAIAWDNRENSDNPASYHAVIDTDGTIYRLVDWNVKAYHAGRSWWPFGAEPVVPENGHHFETRSLNPYTFGVAFANRDDERASLTLPQLASGWWLAQIIMHEKSHIPPAMNVAHREVAPGRKTDPNPLVLSMEWWRSALVIDWGSEASLYDAYRKYHARLEV